MKPDNPLNGWKLSLHTLFLGPVFLCLYLWQYRRAYPLIRYLLFLPPALLLLCSWLSIFLKVDPDWIRLIYAVLLALILAAAFIFCWTVKAATKSREPSPRPKILLSRGIAWMTFMGTLFYSFSHAVQIVNYWAFGEYIMVYFSSAAKTSNLWILLGLVFGFLYGMDAEKQYFNKDIKSLGISLTLAFGWVAVYSIWTLFLIVYPLQRLTPIAYRPQIADYMFYGFNELSILFSLFFFLPAGADKGLWKTVVVSVSAVPLILLHAIVLSGYSNALNLTAASILEDQGRWESAKALYTKVIPYIDHDPLLAALHHRQGVLNILNENYEAAVASFKKVIADYSEDYEVFRKARRYVERFEKNKALPDPGRKILAVRHRTFEQAASCFPNSLSVILKFYEAEPVSTRKLSYAIKESFDKGTFIWKVEAFLNQRGYRLITTFWQTKETLMALLEAGYPVLIYVPGHVYTLYGYDAKMEVFFCYNTAKLNRWDDTPFAEFQHAWMEDGFVMSVVVKKGDEEKITAMAEGLSRHSEAYRLYQKAMISRYYASKDNYWEDTGRGLLAEGIGLDTLKLDNDDLRKDGFHHLPWDQEKWHGEVRPALVHKWSNQWSLIERHLLYLLFHKQWEAARELIQKYQSRSNEESFPDYDRLLEMSLAVEVSAGNQAEVLSLCDKLIGNMDRFDAGACWAYYYKAVHLLQKGAAARAAQLLLPLLDKMDPDDLISEAGVRNIVTLLREIQLRQPDLIEPEKAHLLDIYQIRYAIR